MTDATIASPLQRLRTVLDDAVLNVTGGERPRSAPSLERPKQAAHGDYATNAAMLLPKIVGAAPPMIAERLTVALQEHLGDALREVEVAGPGFLNLRLSDGWLQAALADVVAAGERFGSGAAADAGVDEAIHLEFVSNNPTGPVHIGGARGAAFGSALANLLTFHGHRVHREYYVNDYGNQVAMFGASLQARARGEEVPEGGYQGDYIADVAALIPDAATRPVEEVALAGIALMVERQKASLDRFRTTFDRWFSERSLYEPRPPAGGGEPISEVDEAFAVLAAQGRSFEQDDALWLRTTDDGDDKDRVMRRADGRPTYFASDIAYHHDKRLRGFDRVLDVFGADHHGYVARVVSAFVALGGTAEQIEVLVTQFVNLFEDGERAKMSKRAGEFVALDDLVDDIGVDAARWYLLARSVDTTIDLDLDEARQQSQENPVYYVQYAHARIRKILRRAADGETTEAREGAPEPEPGSLLVASERELLLALLAWPDEVAEAAARRAPHRIATYALALARQFSAFYRDCPVLAAGLPDEVRARRLDLCRATAAVLAAALGILGVDAPEEM
ncbi:arginine--tRNA ligase [Patulibacter defluvii]|uniref:arginine--tRNA ligase n=1 Tax=Patulibacter defluvii TaxID=3095358 RepID=UPI002A750F48|nr:arginine--tRNA ligase [Patulibacter sp. DM4]